MDYRKDQVTQITAHRAVRLSISRTVGTTANHGSMAIAMPIRNISEISQRHNNRNVNDHQDCKGNAEGAMDHVARDKTLGLVLERKRIRLANAPASRRGRSPTPDPDFQSGESLRE